MIRALVRPPHRERCEPVDPRDLKPLLEDEHTVVWVDVEGPSQEDMEFLREEFGFHELALEDVALPHQRPKLDEYDSTYFLVFYSLQLKSGGALEADELDLFVGKNYVVAIHGSPVREIEEGLRRWESNNEKLGRGVGPLLYSILDSIVDGYFNVADGIAETVVGIEESILRTAGPETLQAVFALKKRLLSVRRILGPERDALNVLMRQDLPILDQRTVVYLRDVYDHLVRVTDTVDIHADLLTSALDVHLSAISNRLNQIMKTLTSVTIILMSMALVTGVYGMNFRNMPELAWQYGYGYAVGLMGIVGVGLFILLRRKGWL